MPSRSARPGIPAAHHSRYGFHFLPTLALWAIALGVCAHGRAQADDSRCTVKDRSDAVALVICRPGSVQAELKAAGQAACQGLSRCNAWIWDDAAKAPKRAPAVDTDMPKSTTGAARAVWIQEAGHLIELRAAR
jgi:hypothetical protein